MKFKLHIADTLKKLMDQEDTDGDKKITIEDTGPKTFRLKSELGEDYDVKGTYHLSNLLQELVLAKNRADEFAEISLKQIEEMPADRISRMIKEYYWDGLTRTMDASGITKLISDTKNETLTAERLPIYTPYKDQLAYNYYKSLEETLPITTIALPEEISPQYVKSINNKPGILSLKLHKENDGIVGLPFVVPGGRFNEMYGWDSYFESIGLIVDGKVHLAKSMADHFQYQIENYGKILNANRSYYLTRTQPPFYSSLIKEVFHETQDKHWLASHLATCIKEYSTVWMVSGQRLSSIGLNRFLAQGIGIPPETEDGHFDAAIKAFADKENLSIKEYCRAYQYGEIINPSLDQYFIHDRSMRESGHDTSNRLDGKCAHIVPVELNAMLYKYETDIAELIENVFGNSFTTNEADYTSTYWREKAAQRKGLMDQYLWDDATGCYLDYNLENQKREAFVSATSLVPLWSSTASEYQAKQLIENILPKLKEKGGIASCTKESRGRVDDQHPQRQWDYPNGWAPHQMLIWKGLINYGYTSVATELIYKWLFMITKNAADYNGTIPEKYDVVAATHKVFAEYGNVGTDFDYITQEGFGWMNASFVYGISLLNSEMIANLNTLVSPEDIF